VSALKGWPGLVELRVGSTGNQYRPIGFCLPGREFVIVLVTIEKGKLPKRILQVAYDNRAIAITDRSRIREHEFDKTATPPELADK
jgi:hypothetical protein